MIPAIVFLGLTVLIDFAEFFDAFWRSAPGPDWETRWKALDPTESAWLATLTDPEEIELARGFYRHERRYRVYFDLAGLPFLAAAGALLVAGLVPIGILGVVGGVFLILRGTVLYLRDRQIKQTYRRVKDDYLRMTTVDPAPTA